MTQPPYPPAITTLYDRTTSHRRRVWLRAFLMAGFWPSWFGVVVCLGMIATAQLIMVVQRNMWTMGGLVLVCITWCGVFGWQRRHAPAIWQQLDRDYGWAHSTTTAASYADKHAIQPVAVTQFQRTMTLIAATPANAIPLWQRRYMWGWLACMIALLACVLMPTPFDVAIAVQAQTRALAQRIAQQVAELPAVNTPVDPAQFADALQQSTDAQQIVAQLDVASQHITHTQQQLQQYAAAADQLVRAPDQASADAILAAANQLSSAQRDALRQAYTSVQSGNPDALNTLRTDITRQQHATDQWQRTLASATKQAMQAANMPTTASTTPSSPNQATAPQPADGGNQAGSGGAAQSIPANGSTSTTTGGTEQAGGDNSAAAGAGMGSAPADMSPAVHLFVPQIDANHLVTLTTPDAPANGDATMVNGGGVSAQTSQYAYAEIVARAAQQAAYAISDAQIPWNSQQVVREYFAALQE